MYIYIYSLYTFAKINMLIMIMRARALELQDSEPFEVEVVDSDQAFILDMHAPMDCTCYAF